MYTLGIIAKVVLLSIGSQAHILMRNPVPYGNDTLNNSPLAPDGSDFPCKLRPGVYSTSASNTYRVGQEVNLELVGSAVHGGGSCQVSLSRDLQPTRSSEWMVIKSIQGGCPINTPANLDTDAVTVVPNELSFKIPECMEPGQYTLAWTWFNRIGNREMFMNCAPVTILPELSQNLAVSKDSRSGENKCDGATKFPPMFIANINGCNTAEGEDIRFPFPGRDVEYRGDPSKLAAEGKPACTPLPQFTTKANKTITANSRS
ncbi:hypothetical protein BJX96DRAFT_165877 [Aspergillus floccosus]